jgi:microcystin-dependent protein
VILFSLLGTNYGGDGRGSFGLPDLRGRTAVGMGTGTDLSNITIGSKFGSKYYTLDSTNLPRHTHTAKFTASSATSSESANLKVTQGTGDTNNPSDAKSLASQAASFKLLSTQSPTTTISDVVTGISSSGGGGTVEVGVTGGSQGFALSQPSIGVNYLIAVKGFFPFRD